MRIFYESLMNLRNSKSGYLMVENGRKSEKYQSKNQNVKKWKKSIKNDIINFTKNNFNKHTELRE